MTETHVDFIPIRTNKIPSATARINALINYLWKKKQETDISIFLEEQKLIQLQFHMSTRQCHHIMHKDGINMLAKLSREVQEEELSSIDEAETNLLNNLRMQTNYKYFDFNHNYLKLLMNILELYTTLEQNCLNIILIEKHQQL
ncbi:hypothetical protein J3Q64DRAFT_1697006 [Phycomyces blakesleeanus]|uniref:Uncharacterized protein n=2 Tax=Phycomyces blakesleeanus TaxID=4837 RepID=A0A163ALH2_PHYB8|nr:hypothetical protein PHYBLDRAFT_167738 [Phycomyces blakesleeanus NRRL 1555(-)]OAD74321.1 hypothetical protein PHYBLDRAFT_167738 [Phycomyces blakesleeanus NRRL 1555(-)]|eukprot:XP_018292361.1 hypothetical protein PHYBLDRAFT_167738 [Phycomyces blakesleeanus NRRL 1555(-)]